MPERFSWVVENMIAGMERPGSFFPLEEDLDFLKQRGIDVVVNLEEEEYFRDYSGFIVRHIPIMDFGPPRLEDFAAFVEFVYSQIKNDRSIAVHCYAGMGRTNLMIASFLIHDLKIDPREALELVKVKRPFYLVTQRQEEALWDYFSVVRHNLTDSNS